MTSGQRIIPINIEEEMKSAYIDYSMSVIVSRALPDVRDGLKPVHRRVMYGMHELGLAYNKPQKKSARIVGEVLGKYHPHGDASVYDTMVRMAQDWSLRYPLVDGQGNFGSMDGDSPAAMRYTEARLRRIADEMLGDIDKDTVDFALNFDDSLEEPTVLPTKLPNLLINGASGIAVGMATNMLPHNLSEVVDGIVATLDNPDITIEELMKYIKAPDFPTGGIIYGYSGVKDAFETGRGRVVVRGRANIETTPSGKEIIIISEIPYQVNKASLHIKIAELVNEKKIEGISDVRDESDRNGVRIVVDVKRDAMASIILNQLYKLTPLQSSYGVNNVALVHGRPMQLNLKDMIEEFVLFRYEVIVRRTKFELRKAEEKAHILEGYLIALDHLDEVIALIRASRTVDDAKEGLMNSFGLSDIQAKAILEMRLQKLTGLERDKVRQDYEETMEFIGRLKAILESKDLQTGIIKDELYGIKERFGDARRTEITFEDGEINIEDIIPDEQVVITISHAGYIKRTPATEYRSQGRGGRGARGSKTKQEDFIEHMFIASNHNYLLFFTEQGKCYWLRVYEIPEAAKTSSGRFIQNILSIPQEDKVKAYIIVQDLTDQSFLDNNYILFCTKRGLVKKTLVEAYSRPRVGGIIAISINEGDQLLEARLTNGNNEIFLGARNGNAIRFHEKNVRPMGRLATGVIGLTLNGPDDLMVGMAVVEENEVNLTILAISEKGSGKRSKVADYRFTNRGGKGVKTIEVTDKTGDLIAIKAVAEDDDLMITTKAGIVIRMPVNEIRVMGRATQGVRVIRLEGDDEIADVTVVPTSEGEEDVPSENGIEDNGINHQEAE
ncbi:MAG: DNA gyrase subunit A [Lewinellaceae bacterium]|nr:DNA gyrase subunit A [Saprospiraceae bacterium]MCB9339171.1 DNA gyrase subunit A [Lewinellaceae bacterium]